MTPIETYDDLRGLDGPSDRERIGIAKFLSSGAASVAWIPEWLLDDKDVTTVDGYYQLAIGSIEDYSDKAYRITQADGTDEYLPKSEVAVACRADGVETIETPQSGLGSYTEAAHD